jgi:diaminopropionate ammonia-lyase
MTEFFINERVRDGYRGAFDDATYAGVRDFFATHGLEATPLVALPKLAASLGVGQLLIKDESKRMGLSAFKVVGTLYAMTQLSARGLLGSTVVCASAGNHGRAVAHVARQLKTRARVYMSHTAAGPRVDAIRREGAEVVSVPGTYDDAVRAARADAQENGWTVVSDTAWEGAEETPLAIMAGYTWIMDEARSQWETMREKPDVVIVQAGVGGLAGAVISWIAHRFGISGMRSICAEPLQWSALLASARAGRAAAVDASENTIMVGLGCAEPSSVSVAMMLEGCHGFAAIEDDFAREAMRMLGGSDPPVIAGPSGAAGLGALIAIRRNEAFSELVRRDSTVLLINTEGAIDRPEYDSIVK